MLIAHTINSAWKNPKYHGTKKVFYTLGCIRGAMNAKKVIKKNKEK